MKKTIVEKINDLKVNLTHENIRIDFQYKIVFLFFAVLSTVFTIINLKTSFNVLMWSTLIFAILCYIDLAFCFIKHKLDIVARVLFSIEIIALCTFFIVFGEPEGFSSLWSALLPLGGMILYRRKYGSLLSLIQFLIIVFFFWIPVGKNLLLFVYTDSFMLRFPLYYLASYVIGFLFETIRANVYQELVLSREKYKRLSYYDGITGLGNEKAYVAETTHLKIEEKHDTFKYAVIIVDVNTLKITNDTLGHEVGTQLLVDLAMILSFTFKDKKVFRVGGDEFVIVLENDESDELPMIIPQLEEQITYSKIKKEGYEFILSAAIGYAYSYEGKTYKDVFYLADKRMYSNKKLIKEKFNFSNKK